MIDIKSDDLLSRFKTSRYMYVVIMASIFIYLFLVHIVKKSVHFTDQVEPAPWIYTFRTSLYGIGIAMFFVITYVRRWLLSPKGDSTDASISARAGRFFLVTVVTAALCEIVAILGLFLFFIGRQPSDFYVLMALSLIYFIHFFPKYPEWEGWVKDTALLKKN